MMINKKLLLLAPGVVFGAMVMAADAVSAAPASDPDVLSPAEIRENVGRQELLFRSSEMVNAANKLMVDGKYREAIAQYRQIIALLSSSTGGSRFAEKVEFCRRRISDCYYQMAEEAMRRADEKASSYDFEEAIRYCEEAKEFCPERLTELESRITFYTQRRDAARNRENADVGHLERNLAAQQYQVQLLIEQGISLANRDELMQARRKFEQVLLIDPYNDAAMQNLRGVSTRLRDAAENRANATIRRLVGEIEWSAALPIASAPPAATGDNQVDSPVEHSSERTLEQILRELSLPNYVLYDDLQTFSEAMEDLRAQVNDSRKPTDRAINFVIRDMVYADPSQAPKLAGYAPVKASLFDILTGLKERGDLDFKIDENAVIIVARGCQLEEMTTEIFRYSMAEGETVDSLKSALRSAQVTFDEAAGASLTYNDKLNEVISRNTPGNQRKIETYLAANSDHGVPMVQVMFKVLEVSQNDLDELGFSWAYSRTGNTAFQLGNNALLRHYGLDEQASDRYSGAAAAAGLNNGASNIGQRGDADATYNFSWGDSHNRLSASVYALDWADSSDIIYSPRVTVLHNQTARINMTEKYYYPGDYEDADSDVTYYQGKRWGYYFVVPQTSLDDDAQDLGIRIEVSPKVDGRLIRMAVNMPIKQFDSWMVVDSRVPPDPNDPDADDDDDGEYQKKPIFTVRSISTNVAVEDGQTVLIGRVTQDLTTAVHDRIPILADIPFIGRFFQSRYTSSQKTNLLIFMTCRLINPDGTSKYGDRESGDPGAGGQQSGLPHFPRNL